MIDVNPKSTVVTETLKAFCLSERLLALAEEHCESVGIDPNHASWLLQNAEPGLLHTLYMQVKEQEDPPKVNDELQEKFKDAVGKKYMKDMKLRIGKYLDDNLDYAEWQYDF